MLSPQLTGVHDNPSLPFASTLCGACLDVCPVAIDIPAMLVHLRARVVDAKREAHRPPSPEQVAMAAASWTMRDPARWTRALRAARLGRLGRVWRMGALVGGIVGGMGRRKLLTDEMWARIEPLLPERTPKRGGRWGDHRAVVEAVCWRFRTGSPWRDLPPEFPAWQTVWWRFDRWAKDGTWDRVLTALQGDAHAAGEVE